MTLTLDHPFIEFPFMREDKKGREIGPSQKHIENTVALLDAYEISVRYNLMSHALEIDIPGYEVEEERRANATLARVVELAERCGLAEKQTTSHLQVLAKSYHPVADWIRSVPWDGVDRVQDLMDTLVFPGDVDMGLYAVLVRKWLVSAVKAVLPPKDGVPFTPQGVLTFQGAQGVGKTRWLQSLAPASSDWILTGCVIDPHDRDSVQQITSHWIAELGEVDATFKKSDAASLKAFITKDKDVYRSAYARREESVPRRTMLYASVNRPDFLVDETGNRRWWVLRVDAVNYQHTIDAQQLWAQMLVEVEAGAEWWLTQEEQGRLAESNKAHEIVDPLVEDLWATWQVAKLSVVDAPPKVLLVDVYAALPGRENKIRSPRDTSTLAAALRAKGAENDKKLNGYPTYRVVRTAESSAKQYPSGYAGRG